MPDEPPRLAAVPDDDCDPDQVKRLTSFRKAHPEWKIEPVKGDRTRRTKWYARRYSELVTAYELRVLLDKLGAPPAVRRAG